MLTRSDYGLDTELEFSTLEEAVYAGLKNDLGFINDRKFLILSEVQRSLCSLLQSLTRGRSQGFSGKEQSGGEENVI